MNQRLCIEEGCQDNAYNRGVRCVTHLDEHIRQQVNERKRRKRLREKLDTVKVICTGCGIEYDTRRKSYEEKKAYGQQNFYHSRSCALVDPKKSTAWRHAKYE